MNTEIMNDKQGTNKLKKTEKQLTKPYFTGRNSATFSSTAISKNSYVQPKWVTEPKLMSLS